MSSQRYDSSHQRRPTFDIEYLRSISGILRLIEVLTGFGAFITVVIMHYNWWAVYISAMSTLLAFVISLVLLCMYAFHLIEITQENVDWLKYETIYAGLFCILFAFTFVVLTYGAVLWETTAMTWGCGAALTIIGCIALGADFYFKYKSWRAGEDPQEGVYQAGKPPIYPHDHTDQDEQL